MSKILVSGLANIETTLKVDKFPVEYAPVLYPFFGIESTVSGVGINAAKAFSVLGDQVHTVTLIGNDMGGLNVKQTLENSGINTKYVFTKLDKTPQSVILYDSTGKRQINVDLKDIQETELAEGLLSEAIDNCDIAVLCNVNFSRKGLKIAKEKNKVIATDVHVISDIHDEYNTDFMRHANILFMSNEGIRENIEDFAWKVIKEYDNDVLVIGLGAEGALLYVKKDNFMDKFKAVNTRPIVNTIGAGDALFSSFVHFYAKTEDPYESLKKAIVFASYKIGEKGAAQGFLNEEKLEELYRARA